MISKCFQQVNIHDLTVLGKLMLCACMRACVRACVGGYFGGCVCISIYTSWLHFTQLGMPLCKNVNTCMYTEFDKSTSHTRLMIKMLARLE